jgi:hypothetical protein
MGESFTATVMEAGCENPLPVDGFDSSFRANPLSDAATEIGRRYESIARDPRYFQFAHIPDRIIRCLGQCGIAFDRGTIRERLLAYYLFIGVVDDGIDSAEFDISKEILRRLARPLPAFDEDTGNSRAEFMTEILKQHIDAAIYSQVLRKFQELHNANVKERNALSMRAYVEQRKLVGSLTAEISCLLIGDCLFGDSTNCFQLMKDIGAVGCLVDSVFDARGDKRAGLFLFRPTLVDSLYLSSHTLLFGMKIVLKHPRLVPLFVEAVRDNFFDRRRSQIG